MLRKSGIVLFLILSFVFDLKTGLAFLVGAVLSAISGFIGMMVSTRANLKVAESAKQGLKLALDLSFNGGLVTGLLVVSLGLLAVSGFHLLFQDLKALIALLYFLLRE